MPFFTAPGHSEYRAHRGGAAYSEDNARLPENMVRCSYDADTEQYYFRDTVTNEIWEGSSGAYYGHMTRVGGGGGGGRRQSVGTEQESEDGYEDWCKEWKREVEGDLEKERACEREVGADGFNLVRDAVVLKLRKKVDKWREGRDDRARHEPRGHALVRRLTTTRRPKRSEDKVQPAGGHSVSRRARKTDASSMDVAEGRELRLTLMAAGVRRTIFDLM